jgi:serine/threonine protein kinase
LAIQQERGSFSIETGTIVLGRYEIVSRLGEGGMGVVYKAYDQSDNRFVAIKLISQDRLKNQKNVLRFKQEAIATARLDHPTITKVFDCGLTDDEQPYLVMEFAEGKTLSALIAEEGQLPLGETLTVFIEIADGLAHAHANKVLHRDLKPSNIMLNRNSGTTAVKILDFGIAKILQSAGVPSLHITHTGELLGSPLYMSPEQAKGDKVDERSDLYSLGCTIYEALTGGPPHIGDSPMSTLLKRESTVPLSMSEASLGLQFPQELEDLVARLLKHDPEKRYQSALALKRDLLKVNAQPEKVQKAAAATVAREAISDPKTDQAPQSVRQVYSIAAVLLILVTGLVSLSFLNWTGHQPVGRQVSDPLPHSSNDDQFLPVSQAIDSLALLRITDKASKARRTGDIEGAAESYEEAIAYCESNPAQYANRIPDLRMDLGYMYLLMGKQALGARQFQLVRPYFEKTLLPNDEKLAGIYKFLGECDRIQCTHNNQPQLMRARDYYERAAKIYQDLGPRFNDDLEFCLRGESSTLIRLGNWEENKRVLEKLADLKTKQLGKCHPDTLDLIRKLGKTCRDQKKYDEAIGWDKRWVDAYNESPIKQPDLVDALMALATDYYDLAGEKDTTALKQAKQVFERLLKIGQSDPSHYKAQLGAANGYLGAICQIMGNSEPGLLRSAENYDRQALKLYRQMPNSDKGEIARTLIRLGYVQEGLKNDEQAAVTLEDAVKQSVKALGPRSPEVMQASVTLAENLKRLHKFSQADPYYKQCLPLCIQFYGKETRNTANVFGGWYENARAQGHLQQARSLIAECLAIRRKILGAKNQETLAAEAALHEIDDCLKSGNAAAPAGRQK